MLCKNESILKLDQPLYLTEKEGKAPSIVIKDFINSFEIGCMLDMVWDAFTTLLTQEDVISDAYTRSELFGFFVELIKALEATNLIYRRKIE